MIDRIKQVMEYYKLTPASFSEQIGINRSNLTHLFSGRNQPSLEFAKKILHSYPDIRTEWLIMGVGEMWRSAEDKEFEMKVLQEKKLQNVPPNPDLFSILPLKTNLDTVQPTENEFIEEKTNQESVLTVNSHSVTNSIPKENNFPPSPTHLATLNKIIFFYSDNSFEVFHPK
ncbi:MAG: helix-turn-helix transcriptional regulator [Bacteroidales bacterium]|jgi:transcriptional regulator with XRE-family HTH domain|nr:helix-turn-helix transcriptional regulator [Bacteroidales bacterium]